MTPEGRVKRDVKKLLNAYANLYYEMPVPSGYGKSGLDINGCYYGVRFDIECKAPGKHPTERQLNTIEQIKQAGGAVFVIDGAEGISKLSLWLQRIYQYHANMALSPPPALKN